MLFAVSLAFFSSKPIEINSLTSGFTSAISEAPISALNNWLLLLAAERRQGDHARYGKKEGNVRP